MECRQCEHFLPAMEGISSSGYCKVNWGKNEREFTKTYYPACDKIKLKTE